MSVTGDRFAVESLPFESLENGRTVLLTGANTEALKTVFARLVAADEGERSIVLSTDGGGRAMRRTLDDAKRGAGSRASVLTSEGSGRGEGVTSVDDIGDLTRVGMEFSNLVATTQQSTDQFRSGIFLCSTICGEVDDLRSVYRFLTSNFMTEIRRGDGIGVCALDTSESLQTDVDSVVSGMKRSFSGHVSVEKTGPGQARLDVEGVSGVGDTADVQL